MHDLDMKHRRNDILCLTIASNRGFMLSRGSFLLSVAQPCLAEA
jgi:hypothetical protein